MLISHKYKFIYIKNPRTAGTSVEMFFEPYCRDDGPDYKVTHSTKCVEGRNGVVGFRGKIRKHKNYNLKWYNHMPAEAIKKRIGDSIWNSYFKFTIVRNPWDLYVSSFSLNQDVRGKINELLTPAKLKQFKSFVQKRNIGGAKLYTINSKPAMDYYIKYEDLRSGITCVCAKLSIPYENFMLTHTKKSLCRKSKPYQEYYDEELMRLVAKRTAPVIELFNYEF